MSHPILVVDDELNLRRVLSAMLKREGYKVRTASDGAEAMAELKLRAYAAIITDLKMPRVDGLKLLDHVTEHYPDVPVIIITAHGTIDGAVGALKRGAFDYITKPFEKDDIRRAVDKAMRAQQLNESSTHTQAQREDGVGSRFGIIGDSAPLREVFRIIDKVAAQPSTVLITGESGTGKELVAKALHQQSPRRDQPFIRINCAAIPENLMESELFGHEKGAFTGADHCKPGRFELAHKGTLFLDEIGEIPIEMQVKLLRAIQESEFERVGGIKTVSVDVRLVAATNRDLKAEVEAGRFREDLFYRLNVVPAHLPPLRERPEDVPLLIEHFIHKYNTRLHKEIQGVTPEALVQLQRYAWPGNIRELENLIERMILFADGDMIDDEDLPAEILEASGAQIPIPPIHVPAPEAGLKEAIKETVSALERQYIVQALEATGHNVTQAARLLKISRKSLQNKMKEFKLRET